MSRTPTRSTSAPSPHTRKPPNRCPYCAGRNSTRKGTRRKKFETVQLWRCRACRRVFTPSSARLRNKTYPPRVILDALTGTISATRSTIRGRRLKTKYGISIAASSIAGWFNDHKDITSYRRLRPKAFGDFRRLRPFARSNSITGRSITSPIIELNLHCFEKAASTGAFVTRGLYRVDLRRHARMRCSMMAPAPRSCVLTHSIQAKCSSSNETISQRVPLRSSADSWRQRTSPRNLTTVYARQ